MSVDASRLQQLDFSELEAHRVALTGHCYRMLGSAVDADDAVQETLVRAWKSLSRFEGRSTLRTWLYRIATNVCLDAIAEGARRARPIEDGPQSGVDDALISRPRTHWLEPIPDARAVPAEADPAEKASLRQSIRLAFVAALQHLPPKQRAALLLTEVVGCSAAEVAEGLATTVASVNSALQRARATLAEKNQSLGAARPDEVEPALLERYVSAFERYDMAALMGLLHADATLSMPPYTLWLRGKVSIERWLLGRGSGCRGSRLLPTAANGLPAFGQYRPSPDGRYRAWALITLEASGDRLANMTSFLDTASLFPLFGLPLELPASG
jgi:RNA polymerase sigma-70 factor, ECF subfamily